MFIPKLNSKYVFKYPFDGGKKLPLAECFERNKITHFLFAQLLQIQFLSGFYQSTARMYGSAHVNDLQLKTCENNIKIFCNVVFSNIQCEKLQCKLPTLHTVQLNQTRQIFSLSVFYVHQFEKQCFGHTVLKIQISSSNFSHFRAKLDEVKIQLVPLNSTQVGIVRGAITPGVIVWE